MFLSVTRKLIICTMLIYDVATNNLKWFFFVLSSEMDKYGECMCVESQVESVRDITH